MSNYQPELKGHIDIFIAQQEEEFEGEISKWNEVLIHGDPEGLRSLATLLIKIADTDQDKSPMPAGAREHIHLRPDRDLSKSSEQVIIGRLDAKGSGDFYKRYIPATKTQA